MDSIYSQLENYLNNEENSIKIQDYITVVEIANIKERSSHTSLYQELYKLSPEIVNRAGDVMFDFRNFIESAIEKYTKEQNLVDLMGFGGSDSSLDLIYYITWLGVEEVKDVVKNPQHAISRFENNEYTEVDWTITWDNVVDGLESMKDESS